MARKKLNDLSGETKLITTKGLTKNLINGHKIANRAKYFIEDGSQNYLIFQPLIRYFEASRMTVSIKVMACKSKCLFE